MCIKTRFVGHNQSIHSICHNEVSIQPITKLLIGDAKSKPSINVSQFFYSFLTDDDIRSFLDSVDQDQTAQKLQFDL